MTPLPKQHSERYYLRREERIYARLRELPRGTLKERLISGRTYFYLQRREGKKVLHTYIGKTVPAELQKTLKERQVLSAELKQIRGVLIKRLAARIKRIRF